MPFHPTSLKPLGTRLFKRDLVTLLEAQFEVGAEQVMRRLFGDEELVTPAVMWRQVFDQAGVEALSLGDPVFEEWVEPCDVGRDLTLTITLPLKGDARLFGGCAAALRLERPLAGRVGEDTLVLGVECRSAQRALAEVALMSDLELLERQIDEQVLAVERFNTGLRRQARTYVDEEWSRHWALRGHYQAERRSANVTNDLNALLLSRIFADLGKLLDV